MYVEAKKPNTSAAIRPRTPTRIALGLTSSPPKAETINAMTATASKMRAKIPRISFRHLEMASAIPRIIPRFFSKELNSSLPKYRMNFSTSLGSFLSYHVISSEHNAHPKLF